eukprot:9865851-Lingulodinium_polyedra.AAC.1
MAQHLAAVLEEAFPSRPLDAASLAAALRRFRVETADRLANFWDSAEEFAGVFHDSGLAAESLSQVYEACNAYAEELACSRARSRTPASANAQVAALRLPPRPSLPQPRDLQAVAGQLA